MNAMILILNPRAGGGAALKRWTTIRRDVIRRFGRFTEVHLGGDTRLDDVVAAALLRGEKQFVAAGGDGTVNAVLNALIRCRSHPDFSEVKLGAVGIGSSNDFHRQSTGNSAAGIPCRLDFQSCRRQDVGRIEAIDTRGSVRRYFIVNASLGVTAEGNARFNRERGPIALLKRLNTPAAICWAALGAIGRHSNIDINISINGESARTVRLSNLAVLKNTSISAGLRAAIPIGADDGRLGIWMEEGLSRGVLLKIFSALTAGRFVPTETSTIGEVRSLRATSARLFSVEYDGETMSAYDVEFSLLSACLEVCQ